MAGNDVIQAGQTSFRSQVSYVNLVAALIVSALIIVIWHSPAAAAVCAALGVIWTGLSLRSGIDVEEDGFRVRGLLRTRHLAWADTEAFIVVGFSGTGRPVLRTQLDYAAPTPTGPEVTGISLNAITQEALAARVPLFSVVAAVTSDGESLRVHGTASTPLDPSFPADAAAELNRLLEQHNPRATAA